MEGTLCRLLLQTTVAGVLVLHPLQAAAGTADLLVSLDARDFRTGARIWKQRSGTKGISGSFRAQGLPTRRFVGGVTAVVFDGHEDHFLGPATTARLHAAGASHSVAVWVYQGNARGEESLVSWGRRGGPDGSFAGFRYGSDPNNGAVSRWGLQDTAFAVLPPEGNWHHLVFAYDGNYQYLYVNGTLDNAREVGTVDAHDARPIVVGAELREDLTVEGRFTRFSGALSRIGIYGSCLSASDVAALHSADRSTFGQPSPAKLRQLPLHRFSLGGAPAPAPDGTRLPDSLSGVEAVVRGTGAQVRASGLHLSGGSSRKAPYLDLPNGIISAHRDVTLEIWATQEAPAPWSRLVSIGTSSAGEIRAPGANFASGPVVSLCTHVGTARAHRFIRTSSRQTVLADWRETASYPASFYGTRFHDVLVYDAAQAHWFWYRDSVLQECLPDTEGSTALNDLNVWLGRSEISSDTNFQGEISEIRIYNYALSAGEILNNSLAGPGRLDADEHARHFAWQPTRGGTYAFHNSGNSDHWGTGPNGPHPDGTGAAASIAGGPTPLELLLQEPVTLGALSFSRPGKITLGSSDRGRLILETSSAAPAALVMAPQSRGGDIATPLQIKSPTELINLSPATLQASDNLEGKALLTKSGSGPVLLTGSMEKHSGPLEVRRGDLILATAAPRSLGKKDITLLRRGQLVFGLSPGGEVELSARIRGDGRVAHQWGALNIGKESQLTDLSRLTVGENARLFANSGQITGVGTFLVDSRAVLREGSITSLDGWLRVGRQNPGHLLVEENAAVVVDGPGQVVVGDGSAGVSSFTIAGGQVRFREIHLGKGASSSGVLVQQAGLIEKISGGANTRIGGSSPGARDSWGAMVITGGIFRSDGGTDVGAYSRGLLAVHGGECHIRANLVAGRHRTTRSGLSKGGIDVSGGTLTVSGENNFLIVGDEGHGTVNVRGGGKVNCQAILLGAGTPENPGAGVINVLSGGELTATEIRQINRANAQGILQLNGGTLTARAASDNFVSGLDAFWIGPDGGSINTGPFDVVIGMPILEPSGMGVASIPVANGGSGLVAPPLLTITGGSGRGATAVAEIDEGTVTSIRITNRGEGYLSPPGIEVAGGGSSLALGTPVLSETRGGGLTKSGSGTLHLAAPCLIAGPLVVAGGTLTTGPMFIGGRGNLALNKGAGWTGSGVIEGSVTVADGATLSPDPDGGVTIEKDLHCEGTLELNVARVTGQFLKVQGTLTLDNAKLTLAVPLRPGQTGAILIAQYGSLAGRFADSHELPPGWSLDYQFNGQNRIALVRTSP